MARLHVDRGGMVSQRKDVRLKELADLGISRVIALREVMTKHQLSFADRVLDGEHAVSAYQAVYPSSGQRANKKAYELLRHPHVMEYIALCRESSHTVGMLTRQKKREVLAEIALNPKNDLGSRIQAIKVDNAMTGDDAPVKIEGEITLTSIFKSLKGADKLPSEDIIDV